MKPDRATRSGGMFRHAILAGLLAACAAAPALPGPGETETPVSADRADDPASYAADPGPGPLAVRTSGEFPLHDATRGKDLPVLVRTPVADENHPGPFPMIVFSHGAGGSSNAFSKLSTYLASHGYVVTHPVHLDSLKLRRELGLKNRGIVRNVDPKDRTADIRLVLDSIDAIEKHLGRPGLIDRDRLGMAGHSAGAMTTQSLAGVRFFSGLFLGQSIADPEPRFRAFAVISGQGTTRRALTEDSWASIDRPWLVITGSRDSIPISRETPASRQEPYTFAPADGTKYLLFLEGATHSSYQGRAKTGRFVGGPQPDNIGWIADVTDMAVLAFFDAYVKGDPAAKIWLDSGKIESHPGGTLRFEHK